MREMRGVETIPWLYDAILSFYEWRGLGRWRAKLVEGAHGRSLDLGCGTGRNLPLYPASVEVFAMDPDFEVLKRARERAPSVPLVRGKAEQLPFREGAFDTVVSGLVFCSVGDPARSMSEVKRVLRFDGRLRMLEHVREQGELAGRFQDVIQPLWTWFTGGCHPNRETERTVEESGFSIERSGRRAKKNMRLFSARPMSNGPPMPLPPAPP
jgi:ubiquinone/menaquinone biosynthesis C-methylase UbiE